MRKIFFLPLLASTALVACTGGPSHISDQKKTIDDSKTALATRDSIRAGGAQISEGVFIAAERERPTAAESLPAHLRVGGAVTLQSRSELTIAEILARLTEITDLTHRAELGPTGDVVLSGDEILEVSELIQNEGGSAPQGTEEVTLRPNFKGSLPEVLDRIAAHFAMEWSVEDGRVVFRDYVSRTYQVSRFASPGSSSSSVGGGPVSNGTSYSFDAFGELQTSLAQVAGADALLSVSPSTGVVNVTTTVQRQKAVREHIKDFNERMNIQIALDVAVVSVTRSAENNFDIGLAASINRVTGPDQVGRGYTTTPTTVGTAGNVAGGDVNVTITQKDFSISGAISALAAFGEVAVETRTGATTLNNRPVPINQVQDISYAASTTIEQSESSEATFTAVEPGTVTVGYTLQMLPRVLNNRDVQIQYTVEISDASFREFASGDGTTIELPEISRTTFEQQALLENGQTIVLAGFDRIRSTANRRASILSAGKGDSKEQISTVIFITPRILDRRKAVLAQSSQ